MASAILPSRNEPSSGDFMTKFTNNKFTRLQNLTFPNPNPNPSHFFIGNTSGDVFWKNSEQPRSSAPPGAAFTGSWINSAPSDSYGNRYITFRLGSYSRRELKELKKRLVSDLERVRVLRRWICSTPVPKKNYHPPQPTAPKVGLTEKGRQMSAVGQKRTKPYPSVRDTKKQCGRVKKKVQRSKVMMRKCGQILAKLMTHKNGWVFNTPVDAAALKLFDYHIVINNPMDLGTIKSKLAKNEYESPVAFASDVRLTFQNAMVYNGKGSDVFEMAERLLLLFEELFNETRQKFVENQAKKQNRGANVPILVEKPVCKLRRRNDAMTAEEKSELAGRLLNAQLGPEGMDEMMGIIKKGVLHKGNEIEVDLGVLDNETLWELHRFIKKGIGCVEMENGVVEVEEGTGRNGGEEEEEEDVDIGEEIPLTDLPFVEIEKDTSSSDSDTSSSDSSSGDTSSEEEEVLPLFDG